MTETVLAGIYKEALRKDLEALKREIEAALDNDFQSPGDRFYNFAPIRRGCADTLASVAEYTLCHAHKV